MAYCRIKSVGSEFFKIYFHQNWDDICDEKKTFIELFSLLVYNEFTA